VAGKSFCSAELSVPHKHESLGTVWGEQMRLGVPALCWSTHSQGGHRPTPQTSQWNPVQGTDILMKHISMEEVLFKLCWGFF